MPMTDSDENHIPHSAPVLPPDLEARIAAFENAAFENAALPADFDRASWCWMILLGVALPLVLLAVGWWA